MVFFVQEELDHHLQPLQVKGSLDRSHSREETTKYEGSDTISRNQIKTDEQSGRKTCIIII